jgi:hypothetical protein
MITIFEKETEPSTELPASRFPERADHYTCDACGRDVTRKIHRVRGHVGPIVGPERFTCICGARYLSGRTEWDSLNQFWRRKRLRTAMYSPVFLLPAVLCVVVARAAWPYHTMLFVLCCVMGLFALPLALFGAVQAFEIYSILASIWRTRFTKSGRL